jgi:threonine dehydrogenase-like Zn-dependent dehydrogenase
MPAALYDGRDDVRMQTMPEPSAPGEVVLEMLYASICGTDGSADRHGPLLIPRHARRHLERKRKDESK